MSRKPRFILPGVPQHVIQRGNNRESCFYSNDDYVRYLQDLHDAAVKNNVVIYACRELFRHHIENEQVHEIREALNQELVLGRDDFKDKIEIMLNRQTRKGLKGRPRIEEPTAIYYVM